MTWRSVRVFAFLVLALLGALAVDRSKFRTCKDTGFCRRHRDREPWTYTVDPASVRMDAGVVTAQIVGGPEGSPALDLQISVTTAGAPRVRVTEPFKRWEADDILLEAATTPVPVNLLGASDSRLPPAVRGKPDNSFVALPVGDSHTFICHFNPLKFELYRGNTLEIAGNDQSLFHFEWKRERRAARLTAEEESEDRHGGKEIVDYGEDGLAIYADGTREERKLTTSSEVSDDGYWEESFGGHHDPKPNGPMSVGMDFSFPGRQHVYGIPEHATSLALKNTKGRNAHYDEPYRLYNLDVFEFELDQPMALYGSIPMMMAHNNAGTVGLFWFNPTETFVDITEKEDKSKSSRWMSESGVIDVFFLPGSSAFQLFDQYTQLTGRQALPPTFALGYHQCRWNYRDEKDVEQTESKFEELDFPFDVLWLDIEHTDGKRYFTWDKRLFPNPIEMQKKVAAHGRKMVNIVDPHIKRDNKYYIHSEATQKGYYIKNEKGEDFDGWCWPGSSSYPDFTSPDVRRWWAEQFSLDNYKGSTLDLFIWNDMNEPSVFNGPEVSMRKDAKNLAGIEHREWHNLYGVYFHRATAEGLVMRSPGQNERPFVLSRAFFAGTQRYGAIWTGDNEASWPHLESTAPMLLAINLAGLSFSGADVGGFFKDPDAELFTRWYQAGAFQPFFRGHAHLDTKRREPWVFGEPYLSIMRDAAITRYSLLPYWYTMFYHASESGAPVMRAMWVEFPADSRTFAMDDQWMVGDSLLVKPVVTQGGKSVDVYLPAGAWYDFYTLKVIHSTGAEFKVDAPLEKIPVFIREGRIVPRKLRVRRSASTMYNDPFTLFVTLNSQEQANGQVYFDDEHSFDFQTGRFSLRHLSFTKSKLSNRAAHTSGNFDAPNIVERVVIAGIKNAPRKVTLTDMQGTRELYFWFDGATQTMTIKKPDVKMTNDWDIALE